MAVWKPSKATHPYTHGYKRKASDNFGRQTSKRQKLAASQQAFQIITDSLARNLQEELVRQFKYATDDHVTFVAAGRKIVLPRESDIARRQHLFEQIQRRRFDGRVVTSGAGFRAPKENAKATPAASRSGRSTVPSARLPRWKNSSPIRRRCSVAESLCRFQSPGWFLGT